MLRRAFLISAFTLAALTAGGQEPFSVEEAVNAVRANSYSINRSRFALDRARAGVSAAEAEFRPQISFQGSLSLLTNPPEGIAIEAGELGTAADPGSTFPTPVPEERIVLVPDAENTFYRLQSNLTLPLFSWGRLREGLSVAERDAAIALEDLRAAERTGLRDVRAAYFGLVFARRSVELLGEGAEIFAQVVRDRRSAFDAGAATREQVLEAEARAAELRFSRAQAEEALFSARSSLAFLTGLESEQQLSSRLLTTGYRESGPTEPFEELVELARVRSPDVESVRSQVAQARSGLAVARASVPWRPTVGLDVGLELSGQRTPLLAANWTDSWDASLTVSLGFEGTALDFGRSEASIAQAEADLRSAELGLAEVQAGLETQVRSAYERARTREAALQRARANEALANEQLRNAEVSFENDLITRSELLQARVLELTRRLDTESAAFELENALIELEFLVGGIPSVSRSFGRPERRPSR
jgi:outer membrane protein TolC